MKRIFSSGLIEPLEARIAPATIRIGATGIFENTTDTEYHETGGSRTDDFNKLNFTDTSASPGDLISQAVDSPLSNNTFYLRLKAGDTVQRLTEGNNYNTDLIVVKGGNVIAFFTDLNGNNDFDDGELTGLSLGANAVVEINGSVNGDILTNLDEHGTKELADDTISVNGLVSINQGITSLKVLGGSVFGSIFSGGTIKSLEIAKNVESVLAGTAAFNTSFDVFKIGDVTKPGDFLTKRFLQSAPLPSDVASKSVGPSILDTTVGSVTDRIEAGGGGFGSKGGSLIGIKVLEDSNGFKLLAGDGGSGDASSKRLIGGAGGDLANIYIAGAVDNTANSPLGMVLKAGRGGDAESTSKGGVGGKVTNVQVGFELVGGASIASTELVADSLSIAAGDGGSGKLGGLGGAVSQIKVRVLTPDANGNEIEILGGTGGANSSPGGKAGAGGSITAIDVRNQISTANGDILVQAGNGGDSNAASLGAAGGSVQNSLLLGFDLQLIAGDGSDGRIGGSGGTVSGIKIARDDSVIARNVIVNAGHGGVGFASRGGVGGEVRDLAVDNGDFQSFIVNTGSGGNGGQSFNGIGGKGGAVARLDIGDFDSNLGLGVSLEGALEVRSGTGGDGSKGGGAGGSLLDVDLRGANNLNISATSGTGGSATGIGKGGAGGSLDLVQLTSDGLVDGINVTGSIRSGDGGDGKGRNGAGGSGGDIRTTSLSVDGDSMIIAGSGGNGQIAVDGNAGAASGRGGSIIATGLFGRFGSGELRAGDAGLSGAKASVGGSILGNLGTLAGLRASKNIVIMAGNGAHGGAGGDIVALTYGSTSETLTPTPIGSILIQSGNGSVEGKLAGRGGNITNVSGAVSSGLNQTTQFFAGDGGGGPSVTKAAPGGSISDITISRGGSLGGLLRFEAGDAGDAPAASKGGAGGSVSKVGVSEVAAGTIFKSVAAGNGGSASKTGGLGGSISGVDAQNQDIGVRTGQTYGYTTMGGLFAGTGGAAAKAGLNGSVTGVTADTISSIVAGRLDTPRMAEKVGDIYVQGDASTLLLSTNDALVPNGKFQIRFGSQQTALLAANSTAANVEIALNKLSGIIAAGGVTVISTESRGYEIHFNNPGNQQLLSGLEIVPGDVTEEIRGSVQTIPVDATTEGGISLPVLELRPGQTNVLVIEPVPGSAQFRTTEQVPGSTVDTEIQVLDLSGLTPFPNGEFTLTFDGFTTALPLKIGVDPQATADAIETALNLVPSIANAGGVIVDVLDATRFTITFQALGAQSEIEGLRLVQETQRISLDSVSTLPNSKFTLSFEDAAGTIFTTAPILGTATAAEIEAALNGLTSIKAASAGNVTVVQVGAGQFDITFGKNGNQPPLTGTGSVPELQELSLEALSAIPGATFTLSSGNETTPQLPATAGAAQIAVALNNLPSIKSQGGVTVTVSPTHVVDVTFRQIGDKINLTSDALQPEVQHIDLSGTTGVTSEYSLAVKHSLSLVEAFKGGSTTILGNDTVTVPFNLLKLPPVVSVDGNPQVKETQTLDVANFSGAGAQYVLNFNGQNTGVIKTAGLTTALTATAIESALNALGTVKAAGGVTVAFVSNSTYRVSFVAFGDMNPITGEGFVRVAQPGGFLATTLPVDGFDLVTVVAGTPAVIEVDRLDVNKIVVLGGSFTLNFAGETTGVIPIPGSVNALRQDIQDQLNALVAVSGVGGVVVTEAVAGSNVFTITFTAPGNQPDMIGTGIVPETQKLNLTPLLVDPTTDITLEFDGEVTPPLPGSTTAIDIQNYLNALGSISAQGGVRVGGANGVYQIEFNLPSPDGNLPAIIVKAGGTALHEHQQLDLGSLSAYSSGYFDLTFAGQTSEPLPVTASAADIAAALNKLPAVIQTRTDGTGKVIVTAIAGQPGKFDIEFNIFGDQALVRADGAVTTDRYPVLVTQTHDGSQVPVLVSEKQGGAPFLAPVSETTKGDATTKEVQHIDLSALAAAPNGQFTLAFGSLSTAPLAFGASASQVAAALNGLSTVQNAQGVTVTEGANGYDVTFNTVDDKTAIEAIVSLHEVQTVDLGTIAGTSGGEFVLKFGTFTTNPLPATATAAQVQTAINALYSVQAAGGATVTSPAPGQFAVTFNSFGDIPSLSGNGGGVANHETQKIVLGELHNVSGGKFNLTYNGLTTGAISVTASAAEVQAALNALESVKGTRSDRTGAVVVTETSTGTFTVDFNTFGDRPTLSGRSLVAADRIINSVENAAGSAGILVPVAETVKGAAAVNEVQTINLADVVNAGGEFQLRFDRSDAGLVTASTTNILTSSASAADVQAALNGIASIIAAGGVKVDAGANNTFSVTFNNPGDQPSLIGFGGHHEQQTVSFGEVGTLQNALFRLVVNGEPTKALKVGATAAEVDAALEALASIKVLRSNNEGSVNVVATPGVATGFTIDFNDLGNQSAISTIATVAVETPVDINEVTAGTDSTAEQQLLNLHHFGAVENGRIRLTFGADTTAPINGDATSLQIQDALNALPSIKALGNGTGKVTVIDIAPGIYRIDFGVFGDQPNIIGTKNSFGATERLPGSTPIGELDAALDGVSFVNVDLSASTLPNNVIVKFTESVDQPLIHGKVYTHENQRVDVYEQGDYVLSYGGDTTTILRPNSSAIEIRDALNVLPSIIALGGIKEVVLGENSSFSFTFEGDNDPIRIEAAQTLAPLPVVANIEGDSTAREVQTVNFITKGAFVPQKYADGSLVGAIKDFNEIDSNVFHYFEKNGLPGFNEGDLPIDGIVMAKILDQATINFIPEAKFTANGFFDSNNRI
ncbi:MAG: hypothetical protein JWL59_928 [Chthoniobacteraceae bacterium]|nr:hypothetical protein [Chthoniobacteraceae bacterium]